MADPAVTVDGVRLAELIDQLPLSRGSVFELVKALGIVTTKGPGPGGRGRVAWVSSADADRLSEAAHRVDRGEVRIADLSGGLFWSDHPKAVQLIASPNPFGLSEDNPYPASGHGSHDLRRSFMQREPQP